MHLWCLAADGLLSDHWQVVWLKKYIRLSQAKLFEGQPFSLNYKEEIALATLFMLYHAGAVSFCIEVSVVLLKCLLRKRCVFFMKM